MCKIGSPLLSFLSCSLCTLLQRNAKSKILIASQSNVAVDNSLSKIKGLLPDVSMIRVGIREKFSESIIEYTFENFCKSWGKDVIQKCVEALEAYKKKLGIDQSIFEKNSIITEIEDLMENLSIWSSEKKNIQNEKSIINEQMEKWSLMNSKLEDIVSEIAKEKDKPIEPSISKILEDFSENIQLIEMYYSEMIENIGDLSYRKAEVDKEYREVVEKISVGEQEINEWQEMLGISDLADYDNTKKRIQAELKENQKKYNQLSRIESICREWQQRVKAGNDLYQECLTDVCVVGATCLGITNLSSKSELKFDWVIIDEAGKATPPEILVPIGLGNKIVLVGDHKQLPPVVDSALDKENLEELEITKEDLEESLFEYLEGRISSSCKNILNEQYRMHPVIGEMISEMFYKDEGLISKTNAEEKNIETALWGKRLLYGFPQVKRKNQRKKLLINRSIKHIEICASVMLFLSIY